MTENVRKVFDMLGVEPNEEFEMLLGNTCKFSFKCKIDEKLQGFYFDGVDWIFFYDLLCDLLNDSNKIIKLQKKKKLRDLTKGEYTKWQKKNCTTQSSCDECIFRNVNCQRFYNSCWIDHKYLYSDKFLDQEIEVEDD